MSIKDLIIEGLSIKPITEQEIEQKTNEIFDKQVINKIEMDLKNDIKKIINGGIKNGKI